MFFGRQHLLKRGSFQFLRSCVRLSWKQRNSMSSAANRRAQSRNNKRTGNAPSPLWRTCDKSDLISSTKSPPRQSPARAVEYLSDDEQADAAPCVDHIIRPKHADVEIPSNMMVTDFVFAGHKAGPRLIIACYSFL